MSDLSLDGLRVGIFGLGEAGSEMAVGLVAAGAAVKGFDPEPVATPDGVDRCDTPGAVVADAQLVLAITGAVDAMAALEQAFDAIPDDVVYADLSTSAPASKRELEERAAGKVAFVDVALMTNAPGRGAMIPSLACGPGAERYAAMLAPARVPIEVVSDVVGDAATRKLVRSVAIKGLAAVVMESLAAAETAGLHGTTWQILAEEFAAMDEQYLRRLVEGTPLHAERRYHEMLAAGQLLVELGIEPVMTRSTIDHLDRLR